ncbi:MAG: hypothetical protein JWN86_276 [Planctomycetota bacterium]|nr:hypothetical protein [Planctomycetota bacterium]
MIGFAYTALCAWPLVAIFLFSKMTPSKAAVRAFVLGWLFLPCLAIPLPGLPDYTKASAASLGVLLGAILFDPAALRSLRFRPIDLPMLAWCLVPFLSSMTNDLGPYDGASGVVSNVITYGLPYLIGRVYLTTPEGLEDLAREIVIGGLLYIPFCLYELKMSPMLHGQIYGFMASSFLHVVRYGGYRPMVFMQSGLELGMWMAAACLIGIWMWRSGVREIAGRPFGPLLSALIVTTILCKSTGALMLLLAGLVAIWVAAKYRNFAIVLALVAIPTVYMALRSTGLWSGENVVAMINSTLGEDRGESIEFRFKNENVLAAKAMEQPWFGWGGWGRARVADEDGKDTTITDGLWIITLGDRGFVGLAVLTAIYTLPVLRLRKRYPPALWGSLQMAPAAVLAILLTLYMIDNLSNAMFSPVYLLAVGGLMGLDCDPWELDPDDLEDVDEMALE